MKGKAGSRKITKPTQPKAPEDSTVLGTPMKVVRVVSIEDEEQDRDLASARANPSTPKKIRELPYVDVPLLSRVVREDKTRPMAKEGPSYANRAPIEKDELGQEVLEELLNASLDVTVRQLLGTAPGVRKELIKQIAKVRRAPEEEPVRAQYEITVENPAEVEELPKIKAPSRNQADQKDRQDRVKELSRIRSLLKIELKEFLESDSEDEESSNMATEEKEIDVASLPSASSTTVRSKNGRTIITLGDPVLQYLNSLKRVL